MTIFKKKLNKAAPNPEDSFVNPKVLEVNLVKDEVGVEFDWNKHLLSLLLVLFIAAALVAEIYYGLNWWQKQEEEKTVAINEEYNSVNSQIKNISANSKDFSSFKDKLALTKTMADSHVYWTNFFDWLEKNTLNSVSYGGFSGDISGDYNLAATAKTFSDISWQVKAFKDNQWVDFVQVDSGSSGRSDDKNAANAANAVTFSINLKVKPQIFFRQAE